MKISNQAFTNNGKFEILEIIKDTYSNGNSRKKLKLKCVNCGEIQIVDSNHKDRCICHRCKRLANIEKWKQEVGKVYGAFTILEFIKVENSKAYFKIKCNNCGTEFEREFKCIKSSHKNYCVHCKGNFISPSIQTPMNRAYDTYRKGAAVRDLKFELTQEQFENLVTQNCFYCGQEPEPHERKWNKTDQEFYRNGIDRVDSSKGYSLENCVPCCERCNRMKSDFSYSEFRERVSKIYNYFVKEGSTTISQESTSEANADGNGSYPEKDNDIV